MSDFPAVLRHWRKTRRFSQLALALDADVSARHISFLETGRARPSRDMIGRLGEAMDLPLVAKNELLSHAGFAPRYSARDWEDEELAPIREAVDYMLASHDPYPGLALNRLWKIVAFNTAGARLYGGLGIGIGDSLLDLLQSGQLSAMVENWPAVARAATARLRVESAAAGGIAELDRAIDSLSGADAPGQIDGPVVPTIIRLGDMRLSMFATIAQLGTPEDLTLDDLKVELYFPADEVTKSFFESAI
ncbi:MAG: helix-turn-helix domain-containing protein [Pseudomonadota bacterium]